MNFDSYYNIHKVAFTNVLHPRKQQKRRINIKNMEWVVSLQKLRGHKVTNKSFFHTANIIDYSKYILTFITYFKINVI